MMRRWQHYLLQLLLLLQLVAQLFFSPLTAPIAPLSLLQLLFSPQLLVQAFSPLTAPMLALSPLQVPQHLPSLLLHAPLVAPMPPSALLLWQPAKAKAATATIPTSANLRM
jgi:hypothetical protein